MRAQTDPSGKAGACGGGVGRYRYLVVVVIWLAFIFSGVDRLAISLLLVDPGFLKDMNLEGSPGRQGLLMTFLLLPYAFSNVFLGRTADRFGPRRVLTLMTFLWSAAAVWMGAIGSYSLMLVGRVARGTAEGPLFPVSNRYVRYWFPPSERGKANAIWTSGQRVGMMLSVPLLSLAIGMWGWRSALFLQAGFIFILIMPMIWFLTADAPENMTRLGAGEREYIIQGRAAEGEKKVEGSGDLSTLLYSYRFWLMVAYHFAALATSAGLVTWLPKYLREARGFDVRQMVLFASLPYVGSFLSSLGSGYLSDRIGHRATLCTVSLAGTASSIGLSALVPNPVASALLMVLGMAMWGIGAPAYYAIMQRIIPGPIMATGIGIDNGLANFGAAMAPAVIGFLIAATGSYPAGLLFLAVLGLIGSAGTAILAIQRY